METYEKKYNEALEKVRPLYEQAKKDGNPIWSTYEFLFPQLRESEDEKVRQRLVTLVEQFAQGLNKGPMLAYLEKQKEQKPDSLTKYVYSKEDKEFIQNCSYILVANGYATSAERLLSMFEQKPAEKQDYSGLNDLERAIHRGFLVAGVENVPVTTIKETAQDCLAHIPAEWSKEDEEMAMKIDCYLSSAIGVSEEERLNIQKWLKSLRPSWKPSEEQMFVLGRFLKFLHESGSPDFGLMDSLIGKLQKL